MPACESGCRVDPACVGGCDAHSPHSTLILRLILHVSPVDALAAGSSHTRTHSQPKPLTHESRSLHSGREEERTKRDRLTDSLSRRQTRASLLHTPSASPPSHTLLTRSLAPSIALRVCVRFAVSLFRRARRECKRKRERESKCMSTDSLLPLLSLSLPHSSSRLSRRDACCCCRCTSILITIISLSRFRSRRSLFLSLSLLLSCLRLSSLSVCVCVSADETAHARERERE